MKFLYTVKWLPPSKDILCFKKKLTENCFNASFLSLMAQHNSKASHDQMLTSKIDFEKSVDIE